MIMLEPGNGFAIQSPDEQIDSTSKFLNKSNQSAVFGAYVICNPNLTDQEIRTYASHLIYRVPIGSPLPLVTLSDLTYPTEILFSKMNQDPIIKLGKKEHIDSFFNDGTIQLGTFEYYRRFQHTQVGDASEGFFVQVLRNSERTSFTLLQGGYNHYVFCCFNDVPTYMMMNEFNYNDGYEIIDIKGFQTAISKVLGAMEQRVAPCLYRKNNVLVSEVPKDYNFDQLSTEQLNITSLTNLFVKNLEYADQKEFRFVWRLPSKIVEPIIIKVPEAIKFCSRLEKTVILNKRTKFHNVTPNLVGMI
ncbi:MAG: hypothetical protein H2174_10065 [Vampirovibrio sp.]|nr:hypothetical protein [Vampirovibrio sp.]